MRFILLSFLFLIFSMSVFSADLDCSIDERFSYIRDILDHLKASQKISKCAPLKPSQYKVFKKEDYYSTGDYLLRRDENGSYNITLNVEFKEGEGSVSPTEMLQRSKKCLGIASRVMKGPNGERMTIEVLSPEESSFLPKEMRPGQNSITIEKPAFLTHSTSYAENVSCATIIHEMFHLLGLSDEYEEDRPEFSQYNWNCRVVTKAPSIMRDHQTFNMAAGTAINCDCSSDTCKSIMTVPNSKLKNLYANKSFYDISDYKFRSAYCKETALPLTNHEKLQQPELNIILKSSNESKFEVESRFITNISKSPFYLILRSKIVCTCPNKDTACLQKKAEILKEVSHPSTRVDCPMGTKFKIEENLGNLKPGANFQDGLLKIVQNPTLNSILQPNHFYKILEQNCPNSKSQNYQECASFAYKSPPCNVPPQCAKDSYYLGIQE